MRELRLKILPGGLMVCKNKYYSKMRNGLNLNKLSLEQLKTNRRI